MGTQVETQRLGPMSRGTIALGISRPSGASAIPTNVGDNRGDEGLRQSRLRCPRRR